MYSSCCFVKNVHAPLQAVVASSTRMSLAWLCENGFIGWNGSSKSYASLPLGKATSAGSLKPQQALIVRKVCLDNLHGFVLSSACIPDISSVYPRATLILVRLHSFCQLFRTSRRHLFRAISIPDWECMNKGMNACIYVMGKQNKQTNAQSNRQTSEPTNEPRKTRDK